MFALSAARRVPLFAFQTRHASAAAFSQTFSARSEPPTALNSLLGGLKPSLPKAPPAPKPASTVDTSRPPVAAESSFPKQNPPNAKSNDYNAETDNPLRTKVRDLVPDRPRYRLHCHASPNNTITTFTTPEGKTIAWHSGGQVGFKRGNRSSYEAGHQCAVRMFGKIMAVHEQSPINLEIFFKGYGSGREALQKALQTSEGEKIRPLVVSMTDRTPIKIGGTRAMKARRL